MKNFYLEIEKTSFRFSDDGRKILIVNYDNGVESTHIIPLNWGFTRIMQFIEAINSAA